MSTELDVYFSTPRFMGIILVWLGASVIGVCAACVYALQYSPYFAYFTMPILLVSYVVIFLYWIPRDRRQYKTH